MKTLKLTVALLVLGLFLACSEPPAPREEAAATDTAPASEGDQAFEAGFESGDTSEWTEEGSGAEEEESGGEADESPDT